MSSILAPEWALMAEAIHGVNDTHLPDGIHVRALPAPTLGVPATPWAVYRAVLPQRDVERLARQGSILWIDDTGQVRVPPFNVTPGTAVTGYLPEHSRAVWVQLGAQAAAGGSLRFSAVTRNKLGPFAFQSRSVAPYCLAAWTIPMVRVEGSGEVRGVRWIEPRHADALQRLALWELWSLPVPGPTARYTPTADAIAQAVDRVQRAAARRQPMYIAYASTAPSSAPLSGPSDAAARVAQVREKLDRWLSLLLGSATTPSWEVRDEAPIKGKSKSKMAMRIEPFLLMSTVDPDVGHHLGFGDVDAVVQTAEVPAGSLVFYRARALWRWHEARWSPPRRQRFALAIRSSRADAIAKWPELERWGIVPRTDGSFVDLHAMAVALVGYPPDPPRQVAYDVEDRGWLPTPPPPNVLRSTRLNACGFLPHAVAAVAATDARGLRTLHKLPPAGKGNLPLPWVVTGPSQATEPGEGQFADSRVLPGTVRYRLAQGDWFGRWSAWSVVNAPAKLRAAPMPPVLMLSVTAPVMTPQQEWSSTALLSSDIEIHVPIPDTDELPAGGAELRKLLLEETFGDGAQPTATPEYLLSNLVGAGVMTKVLPDGQAARRLVIHRPGPQLKRAEQKMVHYTARWVDAQSTASEYGQKVSRKITDPRTPLGPLVYHTLRYTSRPDVEGHARADIEWDAEVGTRYRVYGSTESVLRKWLATAHPAAWDDIKGELDQPANTRAPLYQQYKHLFGWDCFECLTRESILATTGAMSFAHRVSGSLDGLLFYRVLAEGPAGGVSEITLADLMPFGVPSQQPPAQPQIEVRGHHDAGGALDGVIVSVSVPIGKNEKQLGDAPSPNGPKRWRLRRSGTPTGDVMMMRVRDEGPVQGATVDRRSTRFEIVSLAPMQPLKPWHQYRFVVEVQGPPPPGAAITKGGAPALAGSWSEASAPALFQVVPPGGPAAPMAVTATRGMPQQGNLIVVEFASAAEADSLKAAPMGLHRFDVWRVEAGKRPARLDVLFTRDAAGTAIWRGKDEYDLGATTYYTVRVLDPIGRQSEAIQSASI